MRFKKKDPIYLLIIVYPLVNIFVCFIFNGDNMNLFSFVYCMVIFLFLIQKRGMIKVDVLLILMILAGTVMISAFREKNFSDFSISVLYAGTVIGFISYSDRYIDIREFDHYLGKAHILFYAIQMGFVSILLLYHMQHGLTPGWSTKVLKGPYSYPHTLSYLLLLVIMADIHICMSGKKVIPVILSIINIILILLTAVRTALVVLIVVILFFMLDLFKEKRIGRIMLILATMAIFMVLADQWGIIQALKDKTSLAIQNSDITNGRSRIALASLKALKMGDISGIENIITGVGLSDLLANNQHFLNAAIHGHNDLVDVIVCYGVINLMIYCSQFWRFAKKSCFWILGTIGILAFSNGLFPYIDCVPILVYARVLFEVSKKGKNEKDIVCM